MAEDKFPEPPEPYDEVEYRNSIRRWFDSVPSDADEAAQRAEWRELCALAGSLQSKGEL